MTQLDDLRKQIDDTDTDILNLLAYRLDLVRAVGEFKKENNMQPLQKGRWEEVLKTRKELGTELGISEKLVEDIWNLIHEEALRIEEK